MRLKAYREQSLPAVRRISRGWLAVLLLVGGWLPGQALLAQVAGNSKEAPISGYGPAAWPEAVRMADFILSLQNAGGAIPDEKGVLTVNQDSNMEYALIGLGAAYALLILTHVPLALIGSISLLIYAVLRIERKNLLPAVFRLGLGASLGLVASAFFWTTVLAELPWIKGSSAEPNG